jgi:hypothetical protein
LTLEESYDAVRQGLHNASPSTSQAVNGMMDKMAPLLAQIDDATLDKLLQLMQFLKQHPEQYQAILAKLMQSGAVQPGVFPPEYNPEFVATLGTVLLNEKMKRQRGGPQGAPQQPAAPAMEPPATMATGGIANAARAVREHSRGNDTILAHINPREVEILKAHGGIGTMNPTTGLPEFDFWSDLTGGISHALNAVADGVKSALSSPIGKVLGTIALATFLGPVAGAWALPAASAGVTLAAGGNLKDALISGATAYFAAPGGAVSDFVGSFGGAMAAPAVNAAISAGLVGTGAGLLSGQSLENSVKNGLVAGAISGGATMAAGAGQQAPVEDHSGLGQPNNPVAPAAQPVSGQSPTGQAVSGNANLGAAQAPATPAPSLVMGPPDAYQSAAQGVQAPAQVAPAPGAFTNDMALANAAKGAPAPGGYQAPTIGQAAEDMYGGIKNASWDQFQKGATEMFSPGMTAAQKDAAIQGYMEKGMSYTDAVNRVGLQAPNMVRTYGPAVAAGIGALGLGGGFQSNPVESPMKNYFQQRLEATQADIAANPGKYVPQGYSKNGVLYDTQGRVIGSQPLAWNPATPASTQVFSGEIVPYTPGTLHAATGGSTSKGIGALGNGNYPTDTASYPRKTGAIQGPGTETSDSIPAMLSDGEFVMTAKAVRGAGKGNKLAGAKKMYALMHQLERNATRG